jgi:trehalose-6-phosphatase
MTEDDMTRSIFILDFDGTLADMMQELVDALVDQPAAIESASCG